MNFKCSFRQKKYPAGQISLLRADTSQSCSLMCLMFPWRKNRCANCSYLMQSYNINEYTSDTPCSFRVRKKAVRKPAGRRATGFRTVYTGCALGRSGCGIFLDTV